MAETFRNLHHRAVMNPAKRKNKNETLQTWVSTVALTAGESV